MNTTHTLVSCQTQSTDMRPSLKTFMSPGNTRTVPRCLYPANLQPVANYRQWATLKPNTIDRCSSDALVKPCNLTDIVRLTYSPKSVPKLSQTLANTDCFERMKYITTTVESPNAKCFSQDSSLKNSPSPPQSLTHT